MIDKLIETQQRIIDDLRAIATREKERAAALEQTVRNYVTVIESMPDFATASDYRRLLAPVQEYAQELLEQETHA